MGAPVAQALLAVVLVAALSVVLPLGLVVASVWFASMRVHGLEAAQQHARTLLRGTAYENRLDDLPGFRTRAGNPSRHAPASVWFLAPPSVVPVILQNASGTWNDPVVVSPGEPARARTWDECATRVASGSGSCIASARGDAAARLEVRALDASGQWQQALPGAVAVRITQAR